MFTTFGPCGRLPDDCPGKGRAVAKTWFGSGKCPVCGERGVGERYGSVRPHPRRR
jgi:hypothetical protein